MITTVEKENLLWFCTEEVKEFGSITDATLEECVKKGITLEEINKAIEHLGVIIADPSWREDAINFLLDKECSYDGVTDFVMEYWQNLLSKEENLKEYKKWWLENKDSYL